MTKPIASRCLIPFRYLYYNRETDLIALNRSALYALHNDPENLQINHKNIGRKKKKKMLFLLSYGIVNLYRPTGCLKTDYNLKYRTKIVV